MTRTGTDPRSPGPLANILPTRPMSRVVWSKRRDNHQKTKKKTETFGL